MKDLFCAFKMFFCAVFVAVFIYPLLHEAGHSLVAIILGVEVVDVKILPVPYVVCKLSYTDVISQVLITLGGTVGPFVLSMIIKFKRFWLWFALLNLRIISLYTIAFSIVSALLFMNGITVQGDDIVMLLRVFPRGENFLILSMLMMLWYGIAKVVKERPLAKCFQHFSALNKTVA